MPTVPLLASLGLHAAILFLFADLSDELPDRPRVLEPPAIVADIVIDVPLHETVPVAEVTEIDALREMPPQLLNIGVSDLGSIAAVAPVEPIGPSSSPIEPQELPPAGELHALAGVASAPVPVPELAESAVEEQAQALKAAEPPDRDTVVRVDSRPVELHYAAPALPLPGSVSAVEFATVSKVGPPASTPVAPVAISGTGNASPPLDAIVTPEPKSAKPIEALPLLAQSLELPPPAARMPDVDAVSAAPVLAPANGEETVVSALSPAKPVVVAEMAPAIAEVSPIPSTAQPLESLAASHLDPVESNSPHEAVSVLTPNGPAAALQGEDRSEMAAMLLPPRLDKPTASPRIALTQAIGGFDCARLQMGWDAAEGSVSISGHIRSSEDRDRLVATLTAIDGVKQVVNRNLYIVGEPYCRVLAFLGQPGLTKSSDQRQGLEMLGSPAQSGVVRLKAGMPLELKLAGPAFTAYIYVDYFTADGRVYHLLPTRNLEEQRVEPNEAFAVGGSRGRGLKATIGPPFGLDMVVAVASTRRLFPDVRPTSEDAKGYLSAFDAALAEARRRDPGVQLEYAYYLVQTFAN